MIKNSCIFYLVNNSPIHLRRLYVSLDLLKANVLNKYPYPVVFGHEGLPQDVVDSIKQHAPENHFFYNVKFKVPDYSDDIKSQIPERFKGHWDESAFFSLGYRHMCRFFAGDLFIHTFFEKVKYIMRLDCDSYIHSPLTYDPFEIMSKGKYVYGYLGTETDMDYVIEGFNDACKTYFKDKYDPSTYNLMYQTHFFVADVQYFKNSEYIKFFDYVDQTGNIYIKRWGDAVIQYQGITNTVNSDQIYQFDDLAYRHGGDF